MEGLVIAVLLLVWLCCMMMTVVAGQAHEGSKHGRKAGDEEHYGWIFVGWFFYMLGSATMVCQIYLLGWFQQ